MSVSVFRLRAAIFIDHQNLVRPILNKYRINYLELKKILMRHYTDQGAFVFMGIPEPLTPKMESFMKYLDEVGFVPMTRPLAKRANGSYEEKQVDAYLQAFTQFKAVDIDVAILVSGDGDFVVAVEMLKHENKDVIVWSWRESLSVQLRESVGVNNVFYIDDIIDKIKKKKKRRMIF